MTELFEKESILPVPADFAFDWHLRPQAFSRLVPPWEPVRIEHRDADVPRSGDAVLRMAIGPLSLKWVARHGDFIEHRQFVDEQIHGPFAHWKHTHIVDPVDSGSCRLRDRIEYSLPAGGLGQMLGGGSVARKLDRMFAYRHAVTRGDVTQLFRFKEQSPMKIVISGAGGLVGSQLVPYLENAGHTVLRLTRSASSSSGEIEWDISAGRLDATALEGVDAVIHLAGEGIADRRWTDDVKQQIRDSRVNGTKLLCETLAGMPQPPKTLLCASAMGYYGDRGDERLTEQSPPGTGFLPDVCVQWEAATQAAEHAGIRVVHLRTSMVLSASGGALKAMLPIFRLGGGGVVGSGDQYWCWIAEDDMIGAMFYCLMDEAIRGPVNIGSPEPPTNREFTKTLGRVLHRPTVIPVPAALARLGIGEMADAALLASTRMIPEKLLSTGYEFRFPELEPALRHVLGR